MPVSFNNFYCTPRFQKKKKIDPNVDLSTKDEIRVRLKSELTPKAVNPKYKAILDKFSDLSVFDEPLKNRPEKRTNSQYGHYHYQSAAERLVRKRDYRTTYIGRIQHWF